MHVHIRFVPDWWRGPWLHRPLYGPLLGSLRFAWWHVQIWRGPCALKGSVMHNGHAHHKITSPRPSADCGKGRHTNCFKANCTCGCHGAARMPSTTTAKAQRPTVSGK